LAKNFRRKLRAAILERNDDVNKVQIVIKGAVWEAENYPNEVELARVASEKFVMNVIALTLENYYAKEGIN
jgi:thiamine pyrophosphokinase